MGNIIKSLVKRVVQLLGYDIVNINGSIRDFEEEAIEIIRSVTPYTMTTPERLYALIQAVKYVMENNITGDIVECGVWKGGSMMAVAKTFLGMGQVEKNLYLFDTFEGMTKPTDFDVDFMGKGMLEKFKMERISDESSKWNYASLDEVKKVMSETNYPMEKIHFVKGKVEASLPSYAPAAISLLRLDTDWYESTNHELVHLFPRLTLGGVIIIDDYGHYAGARKAVDDYLKQNKVCLFLNRIDNSARIGVKIQP